MQRNTDVFDKNDFLSGLQNLRGLACLLLVSFHVVGDVPTRGLQLDWAHPLRVVNFSLVDLRMPLFAFISGCVFKWGGLDFGSFLRRIKITSQRLLIPYFTVGIFYCLLRSAVYSENKPFYQLIFYPVDHFWYLQASFLIILCFATLACILRPLALRESISIFVISTFLSSYSYKPEFDLLSFWHAIGIAPYFVLGHLMSRPEILANLRTVLRLRSTRILAALLLAFVIHTRELAVTKPNDFAYLLQDGSLFAIALGMISILGLLLIKIELSFFRLIGRFSYPIFLLHVFFTSACRMLLFKLFPSANIYLIYISCLSFGLIGPVAVSLFAQRHKTLAFALLGR